MRSVIEFTFRTATAGLPFDLTDMEIINYLLYDFSAFGLRIQYWIPAFFFVVTVYGFFVSVDQRRFRKRNGGSIQCDVSTSQPKNLKDLSRTLEK